YGLGTVALLADETEENGVANHPRRHSDDRGLRRVMYYHGGTYDASAMTFTTNSTTVADGPDWRQSVIYYGYPEHLEASEYAPVLVASAEGQDIWEESYYQGIFIEPNRAYREARLFKSGSLAQRDLSVFTGTNGTGEPLFEVY